MCLINFFLFIYKFQNTCPLCCKVCVELNLWKPNKHPPIVQFLAFNYIFWFGYLLLDQGGRLKQRQNNIEEKIALWKNKLFQDITNKVYIIIQVGQIPILYNKALFSSIQHISVYRFRVYSIIKKAKKITITRTHCLYTNVFCLARRRVRSNNYIPESKDQNILFNSK